MKYGLIVEETNKILQQYSFKLTLRQIYYRLVAAGKIPNKKSAYNQLSDQLVKARENGDVDDTRIEDRSRQVVERPSMFRSPDEYMQAARIWVQNLGEGYLRNLWSDQDYYVEVWVEKDALTQVIASVIQTPLRVTTAPSRGYGSYTYLKREAVEGRFARINKPIKILDFRDHDPSGLNMTEDLEERMKRYGLQKNIQVKRVALSMEQIKEHGLEKLGQDVKTKDSRSKKYVEKFGDKCWELDAIEPSKLQKMVVDAVNEYIDKEKWDNSKLTEERDKQMLTRAFKTADITFSEDS